MGIAKTATAGDIKKEKSTMGAKAQIAITVSVGKKRLKGCTAQAAGVKPGTSSPNSAHSSSVTGCPPKVVVKRRFPSAKERETVLFFPRMEKAERF